MILSDKDEAKYPAGALVNAAEVAKAGGTFNEAYALNKGEAYGGIALSDLSSCKYVKPGHVDAEAELFYVDLSEFADAIPGAAAKPQVIPAVGTCAGATSGWGLSGDKMSIEICGTSCTKVQKTVLTQFALFKDKVDTNTFNAPSPVVWARKPIPQP